MMLVMRTRMVMLLLLLLLHFPLLLHFSLPLLENLLLPQMIASDGRSRPLSTSFRSALTAAKTAARWTTTASFRIALHFTPSSSTSATALRMR